MCLWSCCPSSSAVASEAGQTHAQRKDHIALWRMKQDVSSTQLYRTVGPFLCSGKVSFRLFHPLLAEVSNLPNSKPLCFFPNLYRLLRPLQGSGCSHLCPAGFPLCWPSLLCTVTTRRWLFQSDTQQVLLGCAHELMWLAIPSSRMDFFILTEHGDRTANYTLIFVSELLDLNFTEIPYCAQDDFFPLQMGNFVFWIKKYWLWAYKFFSLTVSSRTWNLV